MTPARCISSCPAEPAAFALPGGQLLDGRALEAFTGVATPPLAPSIHGIAVLADPWPFGIAAAALIVLALARRRWMMAAAVPAILLSANLTTQWLKPAFAELRTVDLHGVAAHYPGSWPSGHSTAAMSLALCLVLVVGPGLRPLAARAPRTTRPPPPPLSAPALATVATVALCCAAIVVVARAPQTSLHALQHPTAVLAGLVIGALGLVLTSGLAVVLRR